MVGKEIGIRYMALYGDKWTSHKERQQVGKQFKLRLLYWPEAMKDRMTRARGFNTMQVFDDTGLDLLTPIFTFRLGHLLVEVALAYMLNCALR